MLRRIKNKNKFHSQKTVDVKTKLIQKNYNFRTKCTSGKQNSPEIQLSYWFQMENVLNWPQCILRHLLVSFERRNGFRSPIQIGSIRIRSDRIGLMLDSVSGSSYALYINICTYVFTIYIRFL